MITPGIKRGTAEVAILSVLEDGPLHGYEMARRIEQQTQGSLRFTLAALCWLGSCCPFALRVRTGLLQSDNAARLRLRCYEETLSAGTR